MVKNTEKDIHDTIVEALKIRRNHKAIEWELNIPYTTLNMACKGSRRIPVKYIQPLKKYLKL